MGYAVGVSAKQIGRFVAVTGKAEVFSVHDHVVNLSGRPGVNVASDRDRAAKLPHEVPLFISLVSRERDMTDLAIHVASLPQGVKPGDSVAWSDSPGEPAGGGATAHAIVTASATRWNGSLAETPEIRRFRAILDGRNAKDSEVPAGSARPADASGTLTEKLSGALAGALAESATEESFRGVVLDREENPFAGRARAVVGAGSRGESGAGTDGAHRTAAEPGLGALVGLGIGFTPSGDDFLAGALLAERLLDREAIIPEADRRAIAANLGKTTPGGRTLLWLALQGSFPAYLMEFAEAVAAAAAVTPGGIAGSASEGIAPARAPDAAARGDFNPVVREACATAFRHGETSGMDAISGFTWALGRMLASLTGHRRRV